jgi:RNase H-fold protein (predicted Holliday junction resolvase)
MSEEVKAFAARVEKAIGIRVEMMDERLSSWEAKQVSSTRSGARKSRSRQAQSQGTGAHKTQRQIVRKTPMDDVAAAIILRDYLDQVDQARTRPGPRD